MLQTPTPPAFGPTATDAMQDSDLPFKDPTPDLTPTARRILDAGIRVLERDGFRALTFEKVAREAGEYTAAIRYHFGSKAGFIDVLTEAVLFPRTTWVLRLLSAHPAGPARREAFFRMQHELVKDLTTFRHLYELVPNALRDPGLHVKLRDYLQWYATLDAWALAGEGQTQAEAITPLAELMPAMLSGLALRVLSDPDMDIEPAFDLWKRLALQYLEAAETAVAE
jgi:AcrR family transcriptional regulator